LYARVRPGPGARAIRRYRQGGSNSPAARVVSTAWHSWLHHRAKCCWPPATLVPCRRQWHQFSSCAAGPCLTHCGCGRGQGGFLASETHGGAELLFKIDSTGGFAASRRAARAVRGNLWEPSYHNCALLCGFSRSALAGCCNQQGSRRSLSRAFYMYAIIKD
jgi:hypothetical protein